MNSIVDAPPRQTLSFLRNLFEERGITPKNKLGQNFLIDLNLVDLIVRSAELGPDDLAVEVGCGTGSLTARLAQAAGAVFGVEIDPDFFILAQENVVDHPNVVLLHADVLRRKNEINAGVFEGIKELKEKTGIRQVKMVANLPYAVATPVISNFLLSDLAFERMVVMVQWEIGERLAASPRTKDYGALAVLVQSLADVSIVRRLPAAAFWPRPKVESAIVLIRPNAAKRAQVGDVRRFREFLRELYNHRRKNLRGALAGWALRRRPKDEVDAKLAELGIEGTVRAEALDLEQHLRLCNAFMEKPESGGV
jgi:16S rRNA (adenine1518-N6/adenine1519-N6)-dimethyltransferase